MSNAFDTLLLEVPKRELMYKPQRKVKLAEKLPPHRLTEAELYQMALAQASLRGHAGYDWARVQLTPKSFAWWLRR